MTGNLNIKYTGMVDNSPRKDSVPSNRPLVRPLLRPLLRPQGALSRLQEDWHSGSQGAAAKLGLTRHVISVSQHLA